jgi:sec-independent protein translocase protein TatB
MFPDLSWSHMLLVLVVALVVVGPKDLPKVMRTMGRWVAKARAMADQFRKSFDEMARQSELDELRKELDDLRNMRPLAATERTVNEALRPPEISVVPEETSGVEPSEPIGEGHEPPAP